MRSSLPPAIASRPAASSASALSIVAALLLTASLLACAGSAWQQARDEDTPAAYHRFLREHGGSPRAAEARERIAFLRVKARPGIEGYEAFRRQHPDSPLRAELEPLVEALYFEQARAAGTPEAYRDFLARFPAGALLACAEGNLAFLEAAGFGSDPVALAAFAGEHPESDFAAEAARSAATVATRGRTEIRRAGLSVEIAPGTPEAERLRRVFVERAQREYEAAGLALVPLSGPHDPRASALAARLTLRHREEPAGTRLEAGSLTGPGMQAVTEVELALAGDDEPIWSETFRYRDGAAQAGSGASLLFQPGASAYWDEFFVPFAAWRNRDALRRPRELPGPPAAVDTAGTRAVVLYGDGGFQVYDLGNPDAPLLVGTYRRARDLTRWSGVLLSGRRVLVFGEDGLEIVEPAAEGLRRVAALDRGQVGSVTAAEALPEGLVLAGHRGLLFVPTGEASVRQLVERPLRGLARLGTRLVFTDGASLFVSSLGLLSRGLVEAEVPLGARFAASEVRVAGSQALVLGEGGLLRLDLTTPTAPRLLSRITPAQGRRIADGAIAGGRVFLLGQRGLLVADPSGERIVDSADVASRNALGTAGRHLVMVGDGGLQVVDATPFVVPVPAAPAP